MRVQAPFDLHRICMCRRNRRFKHQGHWMKLKVIHRKEEIVWREVRPTCAQTGIGMSMADSDDASKSSGGEALQVHLEGDA